MTLPEELDSCNEACAKPKLCYGYGAYVSRKIPRYDPPRASRRVDAPGARRPGVRIRLRDRPGPRGLRQLEDAPPIERRPRARPGGARDRGLGAGARGHRPARTGADDERSVRGPAGHELRLARLLRPLGDGVGWAAGRAREHARRGARRDADGHGVDSLRPRPLERLPVRRRVALDRSVHGRRPVPLAARRGLSGPGDPDPAERGEPSLRLHHHLCALRRCAGERLPPALHARVEGDRGPGGLRAGAGEPRSLPRALGGPLPARGAARHGVARELRVLARGPRPPLHDRLEEGRPRERSRLVHVRPGDRARDVGHPARVHLDRLVRDRPRRHLHEREPCGRREAVPPVRARPRGLRLLDEHLQPGPGRGPAPRAPRDRPREHARRRPAGARLRARGPGRRLLPRGEREELPVSHTEMPTERKPPSDGLNKEGTDLSKARKTRRKLERAVADASPLDAEAARAVSGKLSRVRLVLAGAPDAALDPEARKDLGAALEQAEAFASQVAALALQRDELVQQAEEAAKQLGALERKALMAAAKAEALERAREVESDGFEHIEKRLEVESQLRERMEDLARVSERLTQAEQLAQERLESAQKAESKLAEERRRRLELQLELDGLEERYEKFITSRAAIDESAKTQKQRFDQRTQRLYKALLMHEGGLGAELAKSTNELMEASESLIRLETDRSSLLRQVETLRVSLRRAKGLPDSAPLPEDEAISAKHERLFLAIDQLKDQLDRRLQDLISNIEERLAKTAPAPATEPENTAENAIKRQTEFFPVVEAEIASPPREDGRGGEETKAPEPVAEAAPHPDPPPPPRGGGEPEVPLPSAV